MPKDYEPFKKFFRSLFRTVRPVGRAVSSFFGRICMIGPRLRYGRSEFRRANGGISYKQLKRSKGATGEYLLYDRLRHLRGKWLFNLYLPKGEEETEIDSVLFSTRGVFLFESKNFSGRIYGRITQREWFQTVITAKGLKKQRFFNPLMQNSAHKHAFIALAKTDLPVYPVVVFGKNCELFTPAAETHKDELMKIGKVKRFIRNRPKCADRSEPDRLYRLFKPYTDVSPERKYKHIRDVARKN